MDDGSAGAFRYLAERDGEPAGPERGRAAHGGALVRTRAKQKERALALGPPRLGEESPVQLEHVDREADRWARRAERADKKVVPAACRDDPGGGMYRLEDDPRVVRKRRDQGEVRDAPASDRPRPALAGKVDHAAELTGRGRVDVIFGADKRAARTPELVRRHPRLARPAQP